jgi:MinD-like ATPase involved in chromosome partitioning or flagellar assembly
MKGGVGKTETAINLAFAIKKAGRSVALVDLDIPYGGVAQALGQTKEISVTDWINTSRDISVKALKSLVAAHPDSGIHYIPAIANTSDLERFDEQIVQRIITHLNKVYDIIVIDTGVDLSDVTKEVIKISDKIIILTTANHVSAQNNFRYKEDLISLGVNKEKLLVFINMISDRKNASEVAERIMSTFSETGTPVETVAAAYYDEKIAQIREKHGFAYNNSSNSFKKAIDQILKKVGLVTPDFSQKTKKTGMLQRIKGLISWG